MLLNFTIDITPNAAVVILGVCATMWYIAWTGLRRARLHHSRVGDALTPGGESIPGNEHHR